MNKIKRAPNPKGCSFYYNVLTNGSLAERKD